MFNAFKTVLGAGGALLIVGAVAAGLWVGGHIAYEEFYVKPNDGLALQYAKMRANCGVFTDAYAGGPLSEKQIAEIRANIQARQAAATAEPTPSAATPDPKNLPTIDWEKIREDREQERREEARFQANGLMYEFCLQVH